MIRFSLLGLKVLVISCNETIPSLYGFKANLTINTFVKFLCLKKLHGN